MVKEITATNENVVHPFRTTKSQQQIHSDVNNLSKNELGSTLINVAHTCVHCHGKV